MCMDIHSTHVWLHTLQSTKRTNQRLSSLPRDKAVPRAARGTVINTMESKTPTNCS